MTTENPYAVHQGHNIKRFREMLGIKQEAFANAMGETWTQKKVSVLEQKDIVEDDILVQVSKILGIPPEAIRHFSEEVALNIISNTFTNNDNSSTLQGNVINYNPTFNPFDKLIELFEENKKLYERLLRAEQEKKG